MEVKLKIYLVDDQGSKFMGIGVLWLLQEIRREGSIRQAASNLGISYTKAHGMLKTLEEALNMPVLERRKGGDSREGASLTPFGMKFIEDYDDFQKQVKEQTLATFTEFQRNIEKEQYDGR